MEEKGLYKSGSISKNIPELKDNNRKPVLQDFDGTDISSFLTTEQEMAKAPHPTNGLVEDELRFLRPKEVVAILGISRQMLWRMRKAGKFIKPVKITDYCVGFRSDELLSWMNSRQMVDNHE